MTTHQNDSLIRWLAVVATIIAGMVCAAAPARAADTPLISLDRCRIEVSSGLPRYVHHGVEDLVRVVQAFSGQAPIVRTLPETGNSAATSQEDAPVIVRVELLSPDAGATAPPRQADAFHLEAHESGSASEPAIVWVSAASPQGLKFGVVELIAQARLIAGHLTIPANLRVDRSPLFATRGMYAHLHWSYRRPYALRSWTLDDWKRYVDLLTHLGFNTIQIWPMMELLPHPLSAEDQAYLRRYIEVVHYAHEERGMRVFIGSCPNNITEDARGVPIADREYFDFEKRLDPGDPAALERILDARSDLYRTVPDADGYWVIDSDPGGWKGSPSSDFADILVGHRKLIDTFGQHPAQQPLIYWMWYGWGTADRPTNWRATLTEMKQRLPEPWRVHACNPEHLAACRELGLISKVIYFPYNLVESEPSAPLTEVRFPAIDAEVDIAAGAGLDAIQGNVQTPLAQLPNIAYLSDRAWGGERDDGTATLQSLAQRLVRHDADVLVRTWQSLAEADVAASPQVAARLREIADDAAAGGTLTVIMGDWQKRVVGDLAFMLDIHAAAQQLAKAAAEPQVELATLRPLLVAYVDSAAAWLQHTGYHNVRIVCHEAFRDNVQRAMDRLVETRGRAKLDRELIQPALAEAGRTRDPQTCLFILQSITGERK